MGASGSNISRREFIKCSSLTGLGLISGMSFASSAPVVEKAVISLSVFDVDATPPVGSYLAYDKMQKVWDLGLRAKGFILTGMGTPVVICSIDWIGIGNKGYDVFKKSLAEAAGTTPDRVSIHTIHQHDSVWCDFDAEERLLKAKIDPQCFEGRFARDFLVRLTKAIQDALETKKEITHVGLGDAPVYKVASNRRVMGADGQVNERWTVCEDADLREAPEGVIDPILSLVSFWSSDKPVVVMSYYATHPQSYYRTGVANPDFPGIARFMRQLSVPDALHIHFNGAGGNLGAGKYNDGSHENRQILAERLTDGMRRAWENTTKTPFTANDVKWTVEPVALPPAHYLTNLCEDLKKNPALYEMNRDYARKQAWYERCRDGKKLDIACLSIGKARILHFPAELFVEYQLAAKAERPDLFVAVAAYGDYGPGYICTEAAHKEGGYEISEVACNVAPESEKVLMTAIRNLLRT